MTTKQCPVQNQNRLQSIDIVRAMAIACVILGHALIYANVNGGSFLIECIYSFHMVLLFVLSGFVTAASWERSVKMDSRLALCKVGRSARRLLVPYALCGAVVMPIVDALQTKQVVEAFINSWCRAFLLNRFLWYLPCCFFLICIFAAVSLSTRRTHGVRWVIGVGAAFALVVAAHLLIPCVDYIRSVMNYFAAFFAGAWLWPHRDKVFNPGRWLLACSSIAFVSLAVINASLPTASIAAKGVIKPLAGIASLFPLMAIANKMSGGVASGMAHVGRTTLFLYCLDSFATPLTIWHFRPTGIMSTCLIAFGIIAFGVFINFAWEYAILPAIKRRLTPPRSSRSAPSP